MRSLGAGSKIHLILVQFSAGFYARFPRCISASEMLPQRSRYVVSCTKKKEHIHVAALRLATMANRESCPPMVGTQQILQDTHLLHR